MYFFTDFWVCFAICAIYVQHSPLDSAWIFHYSASKPAGYVILPEIQVPLLQELPEVIFLNLNDTIISLLSEKVNF